jgi:hypothetical protein
MRRRLALAAAVVAALLAAGCGGRGAATDHSGQGGTAATAATPATATAGSAGRPAAGGAPATGGGSPVVAAALARMVAAGSARTAILVKARGSARSTTVRGEGASDFRSGRGQLTLHLGDRAQEAVVAVFDRSVVYQRLPGATGARPWVRLDLAGLLGGAGLGLFDGSNPGQTLRFLRGVGDLTQVGTDSVRGARTRHYRATLDLAKAAEELPADLRAGYLKLLRAQGSARRPTELWIDDQGRLRRIRYATESAAATTTVTTEYYDFGVPVQVRIPPADQVRSIG